jgi:hypothetical protein
MTRTARHDVDYFPFYVKDGKTLFILESKYGLQGIGFFTNLMRFLCKQPDHHICIESETDRLYFFAQIHCQEDVGMDMLQLMAKTGKIDMELWDSRRVIVSEDLLESLSDAYRNRINPIIEIGQIRLSYVRKELTDTGKAITDTIYPQTKLNKTKLNKIRNIELPEWIKKETWDAFREMRQRKKAPLTNRAVSLIINELEKLKAQGESPEDVLNQSIMKSYTGVFPVSRGGGNGRTTTNFSDKRESVQTKIDADLAKANALYAAAKAAASCHSRGDAGDDNGEAVPTG